MLAEIGKMRMRINAGGSAQGSADLGFHVSKVQAKKSPADVTDSTADGRAAAAPSLSESAIAPGQSDGAPEGSAASATQASPDPTACAPDISTPRADSRAAQKPAARDGAAAGQRGRKGNGVQPAAQTKRATGLGKRAKASQNQVQAPPMEAIDMDREIDQKLRSGDAARDAIETNDGVGSHSHQASGSAASPSVAGIVANNANRIGRPKRARYLSSGEDKYPKSRQRTTGM